MDKRFLDVGTKIETREASGKKYITGMIPYNSRSEDLGGFVETIDPAAFRKTMNDGADVFAFWAHNDAEVLGSTRAGTMKLEDREAGLAFEIEVRDTAISADRYEAVKRGDVLGTSFGFITERDEWSKDLTERVLKEVRLLEISPGVAFPAYPGAQSGAALRSIVAETRSMNQQPKTAPAAEAAPPEQAPGTDERAAVEAMNKKQEDERAAIMRRRQENELALIKARFGF